MFVVVGVVVVFVVETGAVVVEVVVFVVETMLISDVLLVSLPPFVTVFNKFCKLQSC